MRKNKINLENIKMSNFTKTLLYL